MKIKTQSILTENKLNGEKFQSFFIEYNEAGNVLSSTSWQAPDEIEDKTINKYNEKGQKIEEINFISETEISEHHIFTWNEKNKLIKEEIKYLDGSTSYKTFEYNEENNSVTITSVDDEGEFEDKEILKHNENGFLIEKCSFDEDGQQNDKQINEFNENNKIIRHAEFDEDENQLTETKYTYDENNNLIKRVTKNKRHEIVEAITNKYDENSRIIETTVDKRYVIKYAYDNENKTVIEERYLANGMLQYKSITKFNEHGLEEVEDDFQTKKTYTYEFF